MCSSRKTLKHIIFPLILIVISFWNELVTSWQWNYRGFVEVAVIQKDGPFLEHLEYAHMQTKACTKKKVLHFILHVPWPMSRTSGVWTYANKCMYHFTCSIIHFFIGSHWITGCFFGSVYTESNGIYTLFNEFEHLLIFCKTENVHIPHCCCSKTLSLSPLQELSFQFQFVSAQEGICSAQKDP